MEEKSFLKSLQELHPARKERWVWALSAIGIATVLAVGWFGMGTAFPRTEVPETAGAPGDVPVFEAIRGGLASVAHFAGTAVDSLRSFLFASRTYEVIPNQ